MPSHLWSLTVKKRTVQGGPRDRILITGVRYPGSMERSNDHCAFTISFVTTQNLEEVEMHLRILLGPSLEYPDLEEIDRKDLVERFPPLDLLVKATSTLGINVLPRERTARSRPVKYELVC